MKGFRLVTLGFLALFCLTHGQDQRRQLPPFWYDYWINRGLESMNNKPQPRLMETQHATNPRQYIPFGKVPPWGKINQVMRAEGSDCVTVEDPNERDFEDDSMPIVQGRAEAKCGVNSLDDRIVGGQEATAHSFPWSVSLKVAWGTHFCGGSIISEKFILTAAHCVAWGREILNVKVVVGAHHLNHRGSKNPVTEHTIRRVKYHIDYNKETTDADVALIELKEPIQFRANAIPVCLPEEDAGSFLGDRATAIGWGRLAEFGESSKTLQKVEVEILANDVCEYMYKPIEVTSNMMCAGDVKAGGKDACQGDSGSSLSIQAKGRWTQVGIVSWGRGCGLPQYPGVYTRVTAFRDWINRHGNMD